MPASALDIARSAHQWIQLHGDEAVAKARGMVEAMRQRGDAAGADTWLRIIVAIVAGADDPRPRRRRGRLPPDPGRSEMKVRSGADGLDVLVEELAVR